MSGVENACMPTAMGFAEPSIDYNGTPYTYVEGRAANAEISLRGFDPVLRKGIALTTTQALNLGVVVGGSVIVHDYWTNRDVEAVYHDNAGRLGNVEHFEVSPGLADALGLHYRHNGEVVDGIAQSERMRWRFDIRPAPRRTANAKKR